MPTLLYVLVAQLNRATGCGPVGRGFESLRARHLRFALQLSPPFRRTQ